MLPWKETCSELERSAFIREWREGEVSFRSLCARYGIRPKTGYKWRNRFLDLGWEGLAELSRAPHSQARATSPEIVELIIEAKRSHWTWGPKKLVPWLKSKHPMDAFPSPSTAGEILHRHGLVQRRKRVRRIEPWTRPFESAVDPNDIWSIDFKGWFRTGDGRRCDPLTVSDSRSRYLIDCVGMHRPTRADVEKAIDRCFKEYGLPRAIRTDNGSPFASRAPGGLSRLSARWVKLGIVPERIAPGEPQQNGRHERLHETLKSATAKPPRSTLRAQQRAFDRFRSEYNQERPHEALGFQTPGSVYRPSLRPFPSRIPEPVYERGVDVRRVRTTGEIRWKGSRVFVSEVLVGEPVGLEPEDGRFYWVRFGPLRIGRLDDHARRVIRTPVEVLPMCLV